MSRQVFFDPSGRRSRHVTNISAVLAFILIFLSVLFFLSLLAVPFLPDLHALKETTRRPTALLSLPDHEDRLGRFLLHQSKTQLFDEISHKKERRSRAVQGERVVGAFYALWRTTGLNSLHEVKSQLTHLFPEWLHINAEGGLTTIDWDPSINVRNREVVRICREEEIALLPVLNNAENGAFDPRRVSLLLRSAPRRAKLIADLRDFLIEEQFQGINLDFESLQPADYRGYVAFVKELSQDFHKHNLLVTVDLEVNIDTLPIGEIAAESDFVIPMAYDEHFWGGDDGPIASAPWLYQSLKRFSEKVPAEKIVLGLAGYAYDWPERGKGESLSYQLALRRAKHFGSGADEKSIIHYDPDALNPWFHYEDEKGMGHNVWFLDALSTWNQLRVSRDLGFRGSALWVLGSEDPGVWSVIANPDMTAEEAQDKLTDVHFPYRIEYEGEGEILEVMSLPADGKRSFKIDADTGLVTELAYESFPSSYTIKRAGYRKNFIALTFDDGPHEEFTGKILDVLKKYDVRASFFLIGQNAERYPDLVERIVREGHVIGNHTFTHPNIARVNGQRARLELNTTQRSIQSLLKRSTLLFRPPYNADAEPETAEEVDPLLTASELGYVTVGELIDPQDWNLMRKNEAGETVPRKPADLLDSIFYQLQKKNGNIVLLHDGGGDRTITVETLEQLIPALKKKGYHLGTVAELMGQKPEDVMPPLRKEDQVIIGYDRIVFEALFAGEMIIGILFITAVVLGIGRVLFILLLAMLGAIKRDREKFSAGYTPSVTVLVAAYNEEGVITATVESILRNEYSIDQVIVIDDGSKDNTFGVLKDAFSRNRKVKLISQPNGGKSAALNNGIRSARGDILICIDADTLLAPDAIGKMVRHFEDPLTGAVAGNIKVGNRLNVLTKWQAIEYITSQNLDRRAYDLLNTVTVVPGALGAWRREAIVKCGGYLTDTLAEDMDLTWRLRRHGYRIVNETEALGWTEAPDTFKGFFKQRMRWAFGTLQCLYKHRDALLHYGWFGWFALPSLWVFQILFQVVAPLVDIQVFFMLGRFLDAWLSSGLYQQDWQPLRSAAADLSRYGLLYSALFVVELGGAFLAFRMDREKLGLLWWTFWQRFVYRQIIYAVIYYSLWRALSGMRQGWNKVQRKGTVQTTAA